jgi:hypothetical protein
MSIIVRNNNHCCCCCRFFEFVIQKWRNGLMIELECQSEMKKLSNLNEENEKMVEIAFLLCIE